MLKPRGYGRKLELVLHNYRRAKSEPSLENILQIHNNEWYSWKSEDKHLRIIRKSGFYFPFEYFNLKRRREEWQKREKEAFS